MLRCSRAAYEKCPHRAGCGPITDATYYEGSQCDEFNDRINGLSAPARAIPSKVEYKRYIFEEETTC